MKYTTFNEILDIVDALPEEQKSSLIEIIKNRLIEERRENLAQSIKEAKEELARGEIKKGSVEDLMQEVS